MFKKILVVISVMGLFLPVGVVMAGNGPGGPGGVAEVKGTSQISANSMVTYM